MKRVSTVLGVASAASVVGGVAMFVMGGVGSGNAGGGFRGYGITLGGLGASGFLVGSLLSNAKRTRVEAAGVYNVGMSRRDAGSGVQIAGRF